MDLLFTTTLADAHEFGHRLGAFIRWFWSDQALVAYAVIIALILAASSDGCDGDSGHKHHRVGGEDYVVPTDRNGRPSREFLRRNAGQHRDIIDP